MHGTPFCGITPVTLACLAVMMQTVCLSKMSVTTNQITWCHNPKYSRIHVPMCLLQMMLILGGIAVVLLIIIIGKLKSSVYFYENCSLPVTVSCWTDQLLKRVCAVGDIKLCLLS